MGHEVSVITQDISCRELDGVKLYEQQPETEFELSRWCDIIITHLGRTGRAMNTAKNFNKPVYVILHNTFTNRIVEVRSDVGLIANSQWCREDCRRQGYEHRIAVLRPPVFFDDYNFIPTKLREYISLINLWERKGGVIFNNIAKAMPERKFLGVKGAYGDQYTGSLPNVTYTENTPYIKQACYEKTRILLMPSVYESYGRTAVEAMCSGIPVIASDTPGLRESLGDCGVYIPQDAPISKWIEEIKRLDNEKTYNELSLQCIERAKMLNDQSLDELETINEFLQYEQVHST
jgi:glycosyltransferase involved in cell wall biosynthesis